jgi:hypothetical protein
VETGKIQNNANMRRRDKIDGAQPSPSAAAKFLRLQLVQLHTSGEVRRRLCAIWPSQPQQPGQKPKEGLMAGKVSKGLGAETQVSVFGQLGVQAGGVEASKREKGRKRVET